MITAEKYMQINILAKVMYFDDDDSNFHISCWVKLLMSQHVVTVTKHYRKLVHMTVSMQAEETIVGWND